jgi:hypothetical protein
MNHIAKKLGAYAMPLWGYSQGNHQGEPTRLLHKEGNQIQMNATMVAPSGSIYGNLRTKVLRAKERAPTPCSFDVFTSNFHLSLSKNLKVCHMGARVELDLLIGKF